MKNILLSVCLMSGILGSFNAIAGERIILKDSKEMSVEINKQSVICSSLGYGMRELKINIAELDGWTLFDHSNLRFGDRAGLPCMTAGVCRDRFNQDGFSIDDILQNNPRTEKIVVQREVAETRYVDTSANNVKVCFRVLAERLTTKLAGIEFNHIRSGEVTELPERACTF